MNYSTFQIFGSKSSIDYDILFFVDEIKSIEENKKLVGELSHEFSCFILNNNLPKKKINGNLGVLKDGKLINVYKGTYDEVNNSLYFTYNNHQQFYPQHIIEPYDRINNDYFKHLKLKRCYRFILSFYSRVPELRKIIKQALRGGFKSRHNALSKIDFTIYKDFTNKKERPEDIYKVIAFQLAQTILLINNNIEIYTKEEVINQCPKLRPYVDRELVENHFDLNCYLLIILHIGQKEMRKMQNLKEEIFN